MPYANINATLPEADKAQILSLVSQAEYLMPFLILLEKNEKKKFPVINSERRHIMNEADRVLQLNPQSFAAIVDAAAYQRHRQLAAQLSGIHSVLMGLSKKIEQTQAALNNECFVAANQVYKLTKYLAEAGQGQHQPNYEKMRKAFKRVHKKKDK
jgi:hypothetical protein